MAMFRVSRGPVQGLEWIGVVAAAGIGGVAFIGRADLGPVWVCVMMVGALLLGFLPYMLLDFLPGAATEQFTDDPLEAIKYRRQNQLQQAHWSRRMSGREEEQCRGSRSDEPVLISGETEEGRHMEAWDLSSAGVRGTGDILADSMTMLSHD